MFHGQVTRRDGELIVTIPKEEADRLNITGGQTVTINVASVEDQSTLQPDIQDALDELWPRLKPALEYLNGR